MYLLTGTIPTEITIIKFSSIYKLARYSGRILEYSELVFLVLVGLEYSNLVPSQPVRKENQF